MSCTDTADCSAVGTNDAGSAITATETAGVWGAPTVLSSATGAITVTGVSCAGAGDCTAVGYGDSAGGRGTRHLHHPDDWHVGRPDGPSRSGHA